MSVHRQTPTATTTYHRGPTPDRHRRDRPAAGRGHGNALPSHRQLDRPTSVVSPPCKPCKADPPPHAARSTAPNLSRLYGDADFDLKSGVLTTPNSPPARPRSGQPDRVLGHAATSDPRGDPGDAQGSRVSQPEASCTRGAPAAEKPNRPPTPFGRDSLTYPLFTATGFRGDSSPLDDRRAAWAQCGLRDVDVLPEIKRCG